MNKTVAAALAALVLALPLDAFASDAPASPAAAPSAPARFHLDLESDPTAFVLGGGSAHLGLGWTRVRLDLGVYGMDMPAFVHGNEGFSSSFRGAGAKLQVFVAPHGQPHGPFVGIDGGIMELHVRADGTDLDARQTQLGVGLHGGWRFELPYGFYATPWIGIGWSPDAKDVVLGGRTYESSPLTFFPAVHLGYRFE